ncbi:MAG: hypothetical protein EBR10_00105 [Planctomycetes bacterium]|nr:hypothetical protein [Planctomycetota bacterium]
MLAFVCTSCERGESPAARQADAPRAARIVSLSPGVTATLVELGAKDLLVGRTPWCSGAPHTPAVGTLLDIDAEALVRANPTLLFVQPPVQGLPAALVDLAQMKGWTVFPVQLATFDDCRRAVRDVASACAPFCEEGQRTEMHVHAGRLCAALDEATKPLGGASGKRLLAVLCGQEDADVLAFGIDSYLMEALQSMGFDPALERMGYQSLGREDLLRIKADIVILLGRRGDDDRCGFPTDDTQRVLRVDEPALLQPGGGIAASLGRLRSLLATEVQAP